MAQRLEAALKRPLGPAPSASPPPQQQRGTAPQPERRDPAAPRVDLAAAMARELGTSTPEPEDRESEEPRRREPDLYGSEDDGEKRNS